MKQLIFYLSFGFLFVIVVPSTAQEPFEDSPPTSIAIDDLISQVAFNKVKTLPSFEMVVAPVQPIREKENLPFQNSSGKYVKEPVQGLVNRRQSNLHPKVMSGKPPVLERQSRRLLMAQVPSEVNNFWQNLFEWFRGNWLAAVLGILGAIEFIVKLTPTEKDNAWFKWIKNLIDTILPNRKAGGGIHK